MPYKPAINKFSKKCWIKHVFQDVHFMSKSRKARRRNTIQRSPFEPSNLQAEVAEPTIHDQVSDATIVSNNQCPNNERLIHEDTNLAYGNAGFIGPSTDVSNNSNLIYCKGCRKKSIS